MADNNIPGALSAAAPDYSRGPSVNPYPTNDPAFMAALGNGNVNDTQTARALREDVLRNMRWSGGEANLAADTNQGDLSLGQKPYVPKYDDSAMAENPAFAPGLGGLLDVYKNAPLAVMQGNKNDTSEMGGLFAIPGNKYRLISDGQLVGEASTPEEALALAQQANDISKAGGRKANVIAQMAAPGADWQTIFNNPKNDTTLGTIAKIGLPIALSVIPGLGTALGASLGLSGMGATMVGTGLTAALGSTAGNLVAGENLGNSLKSGLTTGAISGLTAGALQGLGAFGSGAGKVAGDAAGQAAGSALGQTAADNILTVIGSRLPGAGLGATSGLAGGLANAAFNPNSMPKFDAPDIPQAGGYAPVAGESPMIDVVAKTPGSGVPSAVGDLAGSAANFVGAQEVLGRMPSSEAEEMGVTGKRYGDPTIGASMAVPVAAAAALPLAMAGGPGVATYSPPASTDALQANAQNIAPSPEMVVTAEPIGASGSLGAAIPGLAMTLPAMTAAQAVAGGTGSKPLSSTGKTISEVLGGLQLLNSLTGGSRSSGAGTLGAGAGAIGTPASLNPMFSGQLPAAHGIFAPQSFAPRDMSGVDFKRYGYGPAQSFFENVPRNPAEYQTAMNAQAAPPVGYVPPGNAVADYIRRMVPGATDAQIAAYLQSQDGQQLAQSGVTGFAEGGMLAAKGGSMSRASRAVDGPGTGRSDEIPALLSDGEYVIDAETVAMLGDGSSKAGAKRLDDFRVNVRKHKGRNLAKGEFSANAKRPENYLSGGRV